MSRKFIPTEPPQPSKLSIHDAVIGIPKLKQLLRELESFNIQAAIDDDELAYDLRDKINLTLMQIFGDYTTEFFRFKISSLDEREMFVIGSEIKEYEELAKGIKKASNKICIAIEMLHSLKNKKQFQAP